MEHHLDLPVVLGEEIEQALADYRSGRLGAVA